MPTRVSKSLARKLARKSGKPLTSTRESKYGAIRQKVDGHSFDSKAEAKRYGELKYLERGKEISGLRVHPVYPLWCATFGVEILKVKVGTYEADFDYIDARTGLVVTEDVKSEATKTDLYKLKRAIFAANYSREIVEVAA